MESSFNDLVEFVRKTGASDLAHSDVTYLGHLVGVYRDLKKWGCSEGVCRAGMFHSIYGTEVFQRFSLPLESRAEVRELIGERPERLAYLNSAIDYASYEQTLKQGTSPYRMLDRFTGEEIDVSDEDFRDLAIIHMCDRLEQAPRSKDWDFRPETFALLAEQLGGVAKEEYDRVL